MSEPDAAGDGVLAYHQISEADRRVLNPFGEDKLARLGAICRLQPEARLLDLCSGKGELLCTWSRDHGISGLGVGVSDVFLTAARARAAEVGVADRIDFVHHEAADFAGNCNEKFDVVSCMGATWIGDGLIGTLDLMSGCSSEDPLLVVGECFWKSPPTAEAVQAVGDDFTDLLGTMRRIESVGLELVELVVASDDDWDRYEGSQWWSMSEWLGEHPDDPRHDAFRRQLQQSREQHLSFRRDLLGWAAFVLRPQRGPVTPNG